MFVFVLLWPENPIEERINRGSNDRNAGEIKQLLRGEIGVPLVLDSMREVRQIRSIVTGEDSIETPADRHQPGVVPNWVVWIYGWSRSIVVRNVRQDDVFRRGKAIVADLDVILPSIPRAWIMKFLVKETHFTSIIDREGRVHCLSDHSQISAPGGSSIGRAA